MYVLKCKKKIKNDRGIYVSGFLNDKGVIVASLQNAIVFETLNDCIHYKAEWDYANTFYPERV